MLDLTTGFISINVEDLQGTLTYRGFLDPLTLALCRAHPEQTVFLIRNNAGHTTAANTYLAYGIWRSIQ